MNPLFLKVDCHSLPVQNLDEAISFYKALGHQLIWRDGTRAAGFRLPDSDAELVLHTDDRSIETDFMVQSVPEAIQRFQSAGGKLVTGPFEIQIGWCAVLLDPWNNPLVILDASKGLLKTDPDGNILGHHAPDGTEYLSEEAKHRLQLTAFGAGMRQRFGRKSDFQLLLLTFPGGR